MLSPDPTRVLYLAQQRHMDLVAEAERDRLVRSARLANSDAEHTPARHRVFSSLRQLRRFLGRRVVTSPVSSSVIVAGPVLTQASPQVTQR